MTQPRIMLATLCLNEAEYLDKLYVQHRDWKGLCSWVFVEAADASYTKANPEMVTKDGLSVDGTTDFLRGLAEKDCRVRYIGYGHSRHSDPAQGKAPARTEYMVMADAIKPDWIVVLDADEFHPRSTQERITDYLTGYSKPHNGIVLRQREIWRPPSVVDKPLFSYEVTGGLWKMRHCHLWRWKWGLQYRRSHVWPETQQGAIFNTHMDKWDQDPSSPEWVHLGWASRADTRLAKIRYYKERGEGVRDGRQRWMQCRSSWGRWKPGDILPYGAQVIPYQGPIPEIFQKEFKP